MHDEALNKPFRYPVWLMIIWALAASFTISLAFDFLPGLRGDADWQWRYDPSFVWERLLMVSFVLASYIALAAGLWVWALQKPTGRRVWTVVGFAAISALIIQVLVMAISADDPFSVLIIRTTSPFTSGFLSSAIEVSDIGDYLRHFPEMLPDDSLPHVQRHPPGLTLYFYGLQQLLNYLPDTTAWIADKLGRYRCEYWPMLFVSDAHFASSVGGLLALLLNAAALIPFYAVGRRLVGEAPALGGVLLSPLVPGYVFWAGMWDPAFVMVTVLLLGLLYLAVDRQRDWAWWAAGLLISLASFFKYSMLVLTGLVVAYAGVYLWQNRQANKPLWSQLVINGTGFAIGLSSVWVVYWLTFGLTFLDIFMANTAPHFGMQTHYWGRLVYNPYDFVLFSGYAVGLLGFPATWQSIAAILTSKRVSPSHTLIVASALVLIALTISGISRAEVGRVWAFLIPLVVLAAHSIEGGPAHSLDRWVITAVLVAAQTVVMQAVLFDDHDSFTHTYEFALPATATPWEGYIAVGSEDKAIELLGYKISPHPYKPGDTIELKLYWRAGQALPAAYTRFVHVFEAQTGWVAQHDSPPLDGQYPTTCWQVNEIVTDRISLPINPGAIPGEYELIVGLYDPRQDNQRLLTSGPGARDATFVLKRIVVEPAEP